MSFKCKNCEGTLRPRTSVEHGNLVMRTWVCDWCHGYTDSEIEHYMNKNRNNNYIYTEKERLQTLKEGGGLNVNL